MSFTFEIESAASAPRLFKAAGMDWHNLGPKLASEKIVSAVSLSGDGGVGSVRQFNFGHETKICAGAPWSFVKERLDFIDIENLEAKTTLIEGGALGIVVASASTHVKFVPKAEGCVMKVTSTGEALPGVNVAEAAEKAKATFTEVIKVCEAYLLANPDAYN